MSMHAARDARVLEAHVTVSERVPEMPGRVPRYAVRGAAAIGARFWQVLGMADEIAYRGAHGGGQDRVAEGRLQDTGG